jgi:hypothetical protein
MAYIGAKPNTVFRVAPVKDTFTGDGSTTTFDLANLVPAGGENALQVFIDNVRQEPGSGKAYTLGNDGSGDLKRITFSAAPANSSAIYVLTNFDNEAFINTDINGQELFLDADGDTSFTADTDDQIDIKIAGADDFSFTANTFTAKTGSSIVVPEGGLTLGSTAVTSTAAELNALDGIGSTVSELNLLDGSAKSTSSITIADTDAFIVIDGNTTKQIPASDIKTYNTGFSVSSITGATEMAEVPAGTDEFNISDGGALKRIDFAHMNNTPVFLVRRGSDQSINSGSDTKIQFDSEEIDTDSAYDNSSNYRFTVPSGKGGMYHFIAGSRVPYLDDREKAIIRFYINGSETARGQQIQFYSNPDNNENVRFTTQTTVVLTETDYVEVYFEHNEGSAQNIDGGTSFSNSNTFFAGYRISGAVPGST